MINNSSLINFPYHRANKTAGFDIWTEHDLELALEDAKTYEKSFCLLNVHLDPQDSSLALQGLTKALREKI